jgi:hypothetical protein
MTIYILNNDPKLCAQYLDDKSLDKMIKDITQILCTVHYVNPITSGKVSCSFIPLSQGKECEWSQWARECKANYLYLVNLLSTCLNEHFYRFKDKDSMFMSNYIKFENIYNWARDNVPDLSTNRDYFFPGADIYLTNGVITPLPLVMPKKFVDADLTDMLNNTEPGSIFNGTILAYRNYYQVKIKQKIKACTGCQYELRCNDSDNSPYCVKWTNREKPSWLSLS